MSTMQSEQQAGHEAQHASAHDAGDGGEHGHHALPLSLLIGVFVALLVLTFLTVAVTWIDLGAANVWIALFVAFVKAVLVALYFMHLRYDAPFNGLILVIAMLFVTILIGAVITDTLEYQPQRVPPPSERDLEQMVPAD